MTQLLDKITDTFKEKPVLMAIMVTLAITFVGFGYTLHEVSAGAARRDALLEKCLSK